ncbi:MAG: trypsin-like peptidase domain-containing protein [Patescibacteria group bacterium]|jgi:serine protease Do
MSEENKKFLSTIVIISIIVSSIFGGVVGFWSGVISQNADLSRLGGTFSSGGVRVVNEESAVVDAVKKVSPAVVSIIISKNLPAGSQNDLFNNYFFRQFFGNDFNLGTPNNGNQDYQNLQKQEIGGGSGFILTADGYIATNRHVVSDDKADYTVLTNSGKKYPAKVLARDAVNDLAILKIDAAGLPAVELGDSSNLNVGQTAIAIGNALGEFRNTVSVGVISGLARSVVAGGGFESSEQLSNVIQTDASINPGNSGGPLLNAAGQVIGINTAVVAGAQNIGFAIPINEVKGSIESVKATGRIVRPWLGLRYVLINQALADNNKLPVNHGALITKGQNASDLAVIPGSPADKAGLKENDIITQVNGHDITETNPLANELSRFKPGDEVSLKILHEGKEKNIKVKLEEMKQ